MCDWSEPAALGAWVPTSDIQLPAHLPKLPRPTAGEGREAPVCSGSEPGAAACFSNTARPEREGRGRKVSQNTVGGEKCRAGEEPGTGEP